MCLFFCKQKTAYEMRISDWSSDVCSSDLVEPPHPRRALTDLGHALVPVLDQVVAPPGQRARIVTPEVLGVLHLEARVLGGADDGAGAGQLPVREDIAVDEGAGVGRGVVGAGDAVVEQPATGTEPVAQESGRASCRERVCQTV